MLLYQSVYIVSAKGLPTLPFGDGHRMLISMEFEGDDDLLLLYPASLEAAAIRKGAWLAMRPKTLNLTPLKLLRRLERNAAELTALHVSYHGEATAEAMEQLRELVRLQAPPPAPRIRVRSAPVVANG